MGNWLLRDRVLISLIIFTILIKVFSLQPEWVERYYSRGFFVYSSRFLRTIFGWIPFSVGDILYLLAGIFLVVKIWKLIRLLIRRKWKEVVHRERFVRYIKITLGIYLAFHICWGLNYDRAGIKDQISINPTAYSNSELLLLVETLLNRMNETVACVDTNRRLELENNRFLFAQGKASYDQADDRFPFLQYSTPSIKSSLFSHLGHYFGFTGYINPFTNEAHLKTTLPRFVQLSILDHEIAHQVGYGKEDEASFVGFLAGRQSDNIDVRYSHYYDIFSKASSELILRGMIYEYIRVQRNIYPQVRRDRRSVAEYYLGKKTRLSRSIEPFMSQFYDNYLKMNNQPEGKKTYNHVVALLIAYMNKYGFESI